MTESRTKTIAKFGGWILALYLLGALAFVAAQRYGLLELAQKTLLNVSAINPVPDADPCAQDQFAGAIVARIDYRDDDALHALFEELDVWHVESEQRAAVAMVSPAEQAWLAGEQYPFAEEVEMTAALPDPCAIQAQAGESGEGDESGENDEGGIPGYACYRTVEETFSDLAALAEAYPGLAEWDDIGNSWYKVRSLGLAGYDIVSLVLTNKEKTGIEKGELVVTAAAHPRELTTAELAIRFAEKLLAGYGKDADLTWLLDYNRIHVIPLVNPDGRTWVELGHLWRKNTNGTNGCEFPRNGVDLNRNGSFLWNHCEGCSSGDVCSVFYRGQKAASEPETRAIENYLRAAFEDQRGEGYNDAAPQDTNGVFISLHSYGRLILYPWEHSSYPSPNLDGLRRLGRKLGYAPGYRVCNPELCMYRFDGSTTDFAYGTLGVASYTYELGTAFFQSCSYFEEAVVEQNLSSLVYAAKAARRPYQLAAGPDVTNVSAAPTWAEPGSPITLTATADDTRSAGSGADKEPSQHISAARFSIEAPSWITSTFGTLQAADGAFDASAELLTGTLDTTDLQPGTYTVFIEAQDADGNWGPPTALFLEVVGSGVELTPTPTPRPTPIPTPISTPYSLYLPNVWR
ncbi:MAG: M14 family zinc carboxypeptidase [Caldilineaceae bacterium]|nr:M14 family zinc carboxypeptidase [Caldilineaceae bacterium]